MTTTAAPTYVFRTVMARNNSVDGYKTRKGAECGARRQGSYPGTTFDVVERDGLFYVEAVTPILPGPETTSCVDCGAENLPTVATGNGAFGLERCPVMVEKRAHSTGHHVSRDAYDAAVQYERAARVVADGSDARYSIQA